MEKHSDIWNELKEISPGLRLPEKQPDYALPENYFRDLPGRIWQKINSYGNSSGVLEELDGISPLLAAIPRINPFSVPDDYFNSLKDNTLEQTILSEELAWEAKENPFMVPEGYFEGLAEKIMAKVVAEGAGNRPEPVIVSLSRHKRKQRKYLAAAAVAAGIMLTTAVYLHDRPMHKFDRELAGVPDQAIEQYLQYHTDVFDNELLYSSASTDSTAVQGIDNSLPSNDIRDYLDNNVNIITPDTTLN